MKKSILITLLTVLVTTGVWAQGMRQTPEERTQIAMEKIGALNLDATAKAKAETVILDFYKEQQQQVTSARESGNVDREAMRSKREEMIKTRDAKLAEIFTAEQMKKWKDEIEPSLRPQRPRN